MGQHNQQQQQRQQQRPPQQASTTNKYLHSGFMLLDRQGNVQKYLNKPDDQLQQDQIRRKRDLWGNQRRVSNETLHNAEKKMWEGLRDSEQNPNIDMKYGQKGLYKRVKVNAKEVLEEAARNVEAGEKGMMILGKVKVGQETLNDEEIKREEEKEEEREALSHSDGDRYGQTGTIAYGHMGYERATVNGA